MSSRGILSGTVTIFGVTVKACSGPVTGDDSVLEGRLPVGSVNDVLREGYIWRPRLLFVNGQAIRQAGSLASRSDVQSTTPNPES